jgi:hypothetical protein
VENKMADEINYTKIIEYFKRNSLDTLFVTVEELKDSGLQAILESAGMKLLNKNNTFKTKQKTELLLDLCYQNLEETNLKEEIAEYFAELSSSPDPKNISTPKYKAFLGTSAKKFYDALEQIDGLTEEQKKFFENYKDNDGKSITENENITILDLRLKNFFEIYKTVDEWNTAKYGTVEKVDEENKDELVEEPKKYFGQVDELEEITDKMIDECENKSELFSTIKKIYEDKIQKVEESSEFTIFEKNGIISSYERALTQATEKIDFYKDESKNAESGNIKYLQNWLKELKNEEESDFLKKLKEEKEKTREQTNTLEEIKEKYNLN